MLNNYSRKKYGLFVGIFGVISNLILGILKVFIGITSKSTSIMIDAVNSITDSFSSVLIIIGFSLVSKKPTKNHPYGFARYEYICGFVISLFMFLIGFLFVKTSVVKIFSKNKLVITNLTYFVLIIVIIIKYIQMKLYLYFSNKISSSTVKTNAVDTRNDIISSVGILVSMIIMKIFNINVDGYVSLVISLIVIYSSIKMIIEDLKPIVGTIPDKEFVSKIKLRILSYPFVLGVHNLIIHNYGVNNDYIVAHVEMDYRFDLLTSHDLIDKIERDFKDLGLDLTIHLDPVIIGSEFVDNLKNKINIALNKLDCRININDFRVIKYNGNITILFDCLIPHNLAFTRKDITSYLEENIDNRIQNYHYIVNVIRPFT